MQLYILMEEEKLLILLKLEYFGKENKEKNLKVFHI